MGRGRHTWSALVLLASLTVAASASAETAVTIGAIYPIGQRAAARPAIETAVEIINAPHPGLETLPLGAGQGLPNLGGAKIAVAFADDLANPSVAQAQALRLVTHDHVAALIGAGADAETLAATSFAEHHAIPFLVSDAMALAITGRDFGWVYRTTPLAGDIADAYVRFLAQLKAAGRKIATIASVTDGTEQTGYFEARLRGAAEAAGFTTVGLRCEPGAADLSPVVQRLRHENPDAVIMHGDLSTARLLVTTMNTVGYKPPIAIGDDGGFSGADFIATTGNLAQGLIDRSVWSTGAPGSPTAIVNDLYKRRSGQALDDRSARVMQGFFVLTDAINRAASTDPAAIRPP